MEQKKYLKLIIIIVSTKKGKINEIEIKGEKSQKYQNVLL